MNKLLPVILLLAGCGPTAEDYTNALKECNGPITMTLYKNTWVEGIETTCEVDVSVLEEMRPDE